MWFSFNIKRLSCSFTCCQETIITWFTSHMVVFDIIPWFLHNRTLKITLQYKQETLSWATKFNRISWSSVVRASDQHCYGHRFDSYLELGNFSFTCGQATIIISFHAHVCSTSFYHSLNKKSNIFACYIFNSYIILLAKKLFIQFY